MLICSRFLQGPLPLSRIFDNTQFGKVPAAMGLAVISMTVAHAGPTDTFSPYASAAYSYDDNLFRIPDTASGGVRGDRSKAIMVGMDAARTIGQQQFNASAKVTKVSYDQFSMLNYDAKDISGKWRWKIGSDIDGVIGASYVQTLPSFSDFGSQERNLHLQRSEYAEAGWYVFPHWRLRASVGNGKSEYDLPSRQFLNRSDKTSETGLDYRASTNSSIGLQLRHIKGDYVHPIVFGNQTYDQSFTQDEVKLKVLWNYNDILQFQFLGGPVHREHKQLINRDSRGNNSRLNAAWQLSPVVSLTGAVYKEYTPFEGSGFSYSLNKGGSLGARWSLASKWLASGEIGQIKRDFLGNSLASTYTGASDKTDTKSLSLSFSPTEKTQISASLFREARNSEGGFGYNYRAQGASINATLQF